jgi:hypothetical protein
MQSEWNEMTANEKNTIANYIVIADSVKQKIVFKKRNIFNTLIASIL